MGTPVEQWDSRRSGQKADGKRTHTRVFRVETTSPDDTSDDVLSAVPDTAFAGVPMESMEASVKSKIATGFLWLVTVNYAWPSTTGNDPSQQVEAPLDRPQKITYPAEVGTETWFFDHSHDNGDWPVNLPYANSAKEAFETLPERQKTLSPIQIERNKSSFDRVAAAHCEDKVNDSDVTFDGVVYPAGSLLVSGISAVKGYENGTAFFTVTTTIRVSVNPLFNRFSVADRGSKNAAGTIFAVNPANQQPVSDWPLDGSGNLMPNYTDAPYELWFQPYKKMDFSALNPFV